MTATFGPDGKTNFAYCWVAAAGPRVATRIRRSNRKRMFVSRPRVSDHIRTAAPAGGSGVPKEGTSSLSRRGSPTASRSARPVRCFPPKHHFYEHPGGGFSSKKPPPNSQKHEAFCNSTFDHSKTRHFWHRKFKNHDKTRGFALLKRVKRRTGRLQTSFFASCSLPASHGHQIPRAVWLRDARPTRSLAPGGVLQQSCKTNTRFWPS